MTQCVKCGQRIASEEMESRQDVLHNLGVGEPGRSTPELDLLMRTIASATQAWQCDRCGGWLCNACVTSSTIRDGAGIDRHIGCGGNFRAPDAVGDCCDICAAQVSKAQSVIVPPQEMQTIANNGFGPFQLGVASENIRAKAKSAGLSFAKMDADWKQKALTDTSPWLLCRTCYEKTRPYAKGKSSPQGPSRHAAESMDFMLSSAQGAKQAAHFKLTNVQQDQQGFFAKTFRRKPKEAVDLATAGPLAQSLRRCKKCKAYMVFAGLTEFMLTQKAKQHEHELEIVAERAVIDALYRGDELAYLNDVAGMLAQTPPKLLAASESIRHVWAECLIRIAGLENRFPVNDLEMHYFTALEIFHKVGAYDLAAAELETLVALAPQQARYRNQLAIQYYLGANWKKAEETWDEALRLQPEDAILRSNYATALMQIAEHDPANLLAFYKRVFELQPQNQQRLRNLGIACQQAGHWAEAIMYLQAALTYATEPLGSKSVADFKAAIKDRIASCAVKLGRYPEAVQHWAEALAEGEWAPDQRSAILSDLQAAQQQIPKRQADQPVAPLPHAVGQGPSEVTVAYLDALRRGDPPGAVSLLSNFGLSVSGTTREEAQQGIARLLVNWRLLDYQVTDVRRLADETALVLITGGSCGADNVRAPFQQWLPLHFEEGQWRVNNDGAVDGNWLTVEPQVVNQVSVQLVSFIRYLGKMRVYLDVANMNEHIVLWGEEKTPGAKCCFPSQTEELLVAVQLQPNSRQRYYLDFSGWFSDFPVAVEFLQWKSAPDALVRSQAWSYRFEMRAPEQEAGNGSTEGLAALLRHHIERNKVNAPELSVFFDQYFSEAEMATLAIIASDKLALMQADGKQHSFGFSSSLIYYHISTVPVELDLAREWFDRNFGGYTNLLWKLMSSVLIGQCSTFCHIIYGWTQQNGTWVHLAVCPLNDAASTSEKVLPIELLSATERRELGL